MSNKLPASVLQAYLNQLPPDTEVNLSTLATEINDQNFEAAITFFSTLEEPTKIQYLAFVMNCYYYALTSSFLWDFAVVFSESFIVDIEDNFLHKYHLNTMDLVPVRRLVAAMQKQTAKQRIHRKEEVVSES